MLAINKFSLAGLRFVDLFAGIGGFHLALGSLGASCVYASEWDTHARSVYLRNFGILPAGDITKIHEHSIPDSDILCAGFPCQAFSISGKREGFRDTRGTLFFDVARIVSAKRPQVVFMENVKNFLTHDNGNTLKTVRDTLENMGYSFFAKLLNASDYGIAQKRERIYMVAFREDIDSSHFCFPSPIKLNNHVEDYLLPEDMVDDLYISRVDIEIKENVDTSYSNSPIRLGTVNKGGQGERIYSPKGTAITLSANGGGVFAKTGGYLINGRVRRLHTRECARLMGFPDSYQLAKRSSQAYKQLGNSVVVDVLQLISINIASVLLEARLANSIDKSSKVSLVLSS